jgi:hypothetical protein
VFTKNNLNRIDSDSMPHFNYNDLSIIQMQDQEEQDIPIRVLQDLERLNENSELGEQDLKILNEDSEMEEQKEEKNDADIHSSIRKSKNQGDEE